MVFTYIAELLFHSYEIAFIFQPCPQYYHCYEEKQQTLCRFNCLCSYLWEGLISREGKCFSGCKQWTAVMPGGLLLSEASHSVKVGF